jgi:hypothetical protein
VRSQVPPIYRGTVGGLVLDHDIAMLVDIDAKVNVAHALKGVVDKNKVASRGVSSKGKPGGRVLDLSRKSQHNGVITAAGQVGLESAGMILDLVIRLDRVGLVHANNVRTVGSGQPLELLASRVGVWVEDAYYVGDVFVREARVLFAYPSWIEDILSRLCGLGAVHWEATRATATGRTPRLPLS